MTDLAKLVVRLEAQTAQYVSSLDAANRKLARFEKQTNSQLGSIKQSFGKFNKALGVLGVGLSFGAITYALGGAAKKAIEYGDEINKAVAKTGMGAEAISSLAYVAKQSDIEFNSLTTAIKKMQQAVSEAASGGKAQLEVFDALQIDFKELRALKPEDQFELIADRISRIRDPADRTRAAVELFGRAGADLLPLFEQGAEGIRKGREEAERMNAVLTGEQAKALAEADDAIKRLGQAWDGVTRSLTIGVAPGLTTVLAAMNNVLQKEPEVLKFADAWSAVKRAFEKDGLGTTWTDIMAEMQKGPPPTKRPTDGRPPGGRNRKPSAIDFEIADPQAASAAAKAIADAERLKTKALEDQAKAYENVLTAGMAVMEGLRTPAEEIAALYEQQKYALENLAATYPAFADQAAEAMARLDAATKESLVEGLRSSTENIIADFERQKVAIESLMMKYPELATQAEAALSRISTEAANAVLAADPAYQKHLERMDEGKAVYESTRTEVELWAAEMEKLTALFTEGAINQDTFSRAIEKANEALKADDKLTVFWEQASRNIQDLIADGLTNGFEDGAKGALRAFAEMIRDMMIQAIAAQIAQKLFGTAGAGSGGGWVGTAVSAIGSIFGGSRDSGGRGQPGKSYAIGIGAQPEMFVPDQPGNFMPANEWMGSMKPQVNLRNINAFEPSVIRDYLLSAGGEEVLLNFIERNGSRVRAATAGA